jgi:hypothetical protein
MHLKQKKNGEGFFEKTAVETSFSGYLPAKRSAHFRKGRACRESVIAR